MDDYTFLKKIYRHLDLNKLMKETPSLKIEDVDEYFRKIRDALGIRPDSEYDQGEKREFILYTDGAARGNPGPAAVGCVLKNSGGDILQEFGRVIGTATNNVAEYQALIYGLDLALNFQPDKLDIYSDSELLVKQMNGEYKTKNPKIKELKEIVLVKLQEIDEYSFTAIKREFNADADALANKALDETAPGKN